MLVFYEATASYYKFCVRWLNKTNKAKNGWMEMNGSLFFIQSYIHSRKII